MPNADNNKACSDIEHWSTGSGQNYANVRFGSASSQASQSSGDICRICHCESDPQNPLLTPCYCSGSLKYVHQACLQQWLTASETNACELCKFPFIMHTKIKPFNEWRSLDISGIERRRLCCSLLFHCAAALCVIWSLCVLIERAADDVQRGMIDWPFWTKLAVVTVGMTGGIVFMYIQCKAYLHLCHRWKARNRILLIQNAPEKIHPLTPPSPIAQCHVRRGETRSSDRERDRASVCASTAIEIPDNMATVSSIGGAYNYARESVGIRMDSDIEEGRDGPTIGRFHHSMLHHDGSRLAQSPNHIPHSDLDADSLATQASSSSTAIGAHPNVSHHGNHHHLLGSQQHPLGQVAVAANIECTQSQHNYERDWALDDVVSQISSFRPCQQGSGSMTPFHDSTHNVLEHSEEYSSRGSRQNLSTGGVSSDMGRDLTMQLSSFSAGSGEHKPSSIGSGASNAVANGLGGFVYKPHNKRYSNSSIFIENGDALNDDVAAGLEIANDYPKISFRHSSIPNSSPDSSSSIGAKTGIMGHSCSDVSAGSENIDNEQLEEFLRREKRRYSETKLIDNMMVTINHPDAETEAEAEAEAHEPMLGACIENVTIAPISTPPSQQQQQRRSMHDAEIPEAASISARQTRSSSGHSRATTNQCENARVLFKSLPNLSSSAESLLKK